MPRTKSDRPDWTFVGTFDDAMDILESGVRPDDGKTLTGSDLSTINSALAGRQGSMTLDIQAIEDDILAAGNRSATKAMLKRSLALHKRDRDTLRSAIATYKANLGVTRTENAANRVEKSAGNAKARFLRSFAILAETDADFIKAFFANPAATVSAWEKENAATE